MQRYIIIFYFILFFFPDFRKVTIISDSIAKNATGIFGTTLQIFSRKTIAHVANKIPLHMLPIRYSLLVPL